MAALNFRYVLPHVPLQVLKYVVAIGQRGSALSAANEVNLTLSALSRQISLLEHMVGVPLFERHSRGMRPTEAGRLFIEAAQQVMRRMERLASDIDDLNSVKRGHVTLHASEGFVTDLLLPEIAELRATHPQITVEATIVSGRLAEAAVVEDRTDFAAIFYNPKHADIHVESECNDWLVAVVHPDHPLAKRQIVTSDELLEGSLGLLPTSYAVRVAFEEMLSPEARNAVPALTINTIEHLKLYAMRGIGAAVLPALLVWEDVRAQNLTMIPIEGAENVGTRVCLCRHKTRALGAAAQYLLGRMKTTFSIYEVRSKEVETFLSSRYDKGRRKLSSPTK